MKKKNFCWMPNSPVLRTLMQSPLGILAINWVFQGMRGMQRKELCFRLLLESLLALSIYALQPSTWPMTPGLVAALCFAHTLNWLFNGHLWVCVRYFPIYRRNPAALAAFLAQQKDLLRRLPWLDEAVCIGSVGDTGGIRSERSDIDLRLIFPPGIINWLRVNLLLLHLRGKALFNLIPLDLYAYDYISALDRFRQDEHLLLIRDRGNKILERYPARTRRDHDQNHVSSNVANPSGTIK